MTIDVIASLASSRWWMIRSCCPNAEALASLDVAALGMEKAARGLRTCGLVNLNFVCILFTGSKLLPRVHSFEP